MEYTGRGQGVYNTVAGSAGLASFIGLGLNNLLGGVSGNNTDFIDVKTENAILKSELNTERKILDVYNDLSSKITTVDSKVDANAAAQAVINCGMNSATAVLQTQVAGVLGMTKMVIPSTNICSSTETTTA